MKNCLKCFNRWCHLAVKIKDTNDLNDLNDLNALNHYSGETDSIHTQEHKNYGGARFMTFMIYLSDVESGGHTVFPSIDIFVKPKAGDALFWFNLDSNGSYDTRNIHLGCPVLYGNKWISNKWVKWLDQMWHYPCHIQKGKGFTMNHIFS